MCLLRRVGDAAFRLGHKAGEDGRRATPGIVWRQRFALTAHMTPGSTDDDAREGGWGGGEEQRR